MRDGYGVCGTNSIAFISGDAGMLLAELHLRLAKG